MQRRRRLCMGLLFALIAVLVVMVSSLKYNEDIYDFLPMDENQQKAITLYQDISGGKSIVAMFKMKDDGETDTDLLAEAVDSFTEKLQSGTGKRHIKDLTSQVDFDKIAGITDFAYGNLPLMLRDSDYVRMEHIISNPELVKEQLANDVQMILMPATGYFANNISNDPLGLFSPVMKRMQARQASMPFEMDNGYIFTADKRYAIVLMTSVYGSMESANNALLVNYVDSVSQETMKVLPKVDIAITGSPVIAVDNSRQIKADSRWAILISVVLILSLLVFSFRSGKNLMLIGLSIVFGWLFAMAFIAVARTNVSIIVLGIGSIIIGIAVNYPLHFVAHTDHGGSIREVLKDMVAPLLIGNITTVGAFAALIPLDAPALRDLGLFAAFMLVGTILFVLIFLPHLVRQRAQGREERLLFGRISEKSIRIRGWMFWLIMALTVVFGYFSFYTSFDANMHHVNYLTPTQERLMADLHISAGVKDTANVYLVTEGNTWDEALKGRARMAPLLDSLKQCRQIESYSDVTSFICSEQEQAARIKRWDEFWAKHRDNVFALLKQYAPQYEFSADAFSGFTEIVEQQYTVHSFDYFEPLVTALFNSSFSSSTGHPSVVDIIDVGKGDVQAVEALINNSNPVSPPQVGGSREGTSYSFDFVGMNSAVANALSSDFNYIGFACGFIVFLFLWISFGRLELSLLAFIPMAVGWLWILGIMYLFGMQFNIVNVILATFIFGQGDDYTIFMTDGLINEYAYRKKVLPSYRNSIIISALIMFIGMGSLIVAKHPALHSLAEVTIVGMFTVVLMAWIVPPMIFNWLVRTDGKSRHTPVTTEQFIRTTYCAVVYLFEIFYGVVFGLIIKLIPWRREAHQAWLHRVVNKSMKANVNNIWGVKTVITNAHNEDFSRGSIIISNHQSILDPIYMLSLSPRILILISGKVWNNPVVHTLFKLVGFINLDQPMEQLTADIAQAVKKGYNVVIFPEGKRNMEKITRFHKGAFIIAQEIGADILPVYLHGVGNVMPKNSAFASRGRIDVEIGQRITAEELKAYGDSDQRIAQSFHRSYVEHFTQMRKTIATTHYFHDYIIYKYIYKGIGIERETRRMLKQNNDYSELIDGYKPIVTNDSDVCTQLSIINSGRGQVPLLFALVHPELEIHSYAFDADDVALATACAPLPPNLHIHYAENEELACAEARNTHIITITPKS